jgi:hypothetical protein
MHFNFLYIVLAALIPMIIGFIYYHPKVVGGAWMKASGVTDETMKGANMGIIFGASLLLSFLVSVSIAMFVTHQTDLHSMFNDLDGYGVEGSAITNLMTEALAISGDRYLSFSHGAFHGTLIGLLFVFPIMATNNLFERRPFKLTVINAVYWIITLALMGGVLCQFGFKTFTAM